MSDSALTVHNVSKYFQSNGRNIQALDKVCFDLEPGRVTGLIGPDGAGKTTMMRMIAGLLQADGGNITALGLDTDTQAIQLQAQIGYMPQRFGLYEDLSVQENLDLYADLQGVATKDRPEIFNNLLRMTGLAPFIDRLAGKLSGGMKQKLGLACTLVRSPQLLLLDEPTVGIDPVSRRELWDIVYHQVEQKGMTVLLSTAYLDEAERCHDVILLHEGKLIKQGPPNQFSQIVEGRVYRVRASSISSRQLQSHLNHHDGIVDALVENESVRIVTSEQFTPTPSNLLPDIADLTLTALSPHFEDAFVAMLKPQTEAVNNTTSIHINVDSLHDGKVIIVDKLSRKFGEFTAVNDISFEVDRGEIFGLLGANGAGKSTTFRMICGLLPATSGHIAIAGKDLRIAAASARARIGYMAQKFSLYSHLSVQQNLQFFSSAYGLRGNNQKQRIDWALTTFELESYRNSNAGELPLGFKQRLSFATALMHEPEILFLDEPTSGVDPLARREFWERTNKLAESGVTILVTTHFMEEANYCDRLVIMSNGEILTTGTPLSIREQVQTPENPEPSMEDAFIQLIQQRSHHA